MEEVKKHIVAANKLLEAVAASGSSERVSRKQAAAIVRKIQKVKKADVFDITAVSELVEKGLWLTIDKANINDAISMLIEAQEMEEHRQEWNINHLLTEEVQKDLATDCGHTAMCEHLLDIGLWWPSEPTYQKMSILLQLATQQAELSAEAKNTHLKWMKSVWAQVKVKRKRNGGQTPAPLVIVVDNAVQYIEEFGERANLIDFAEPLYADHQLHALSQGNWMRWHEKTRKSSIAAAPAAPACSSTERPCAPAGSPMEQMQSMMQMMMMPMLQQMFQQNMEQFMGQMQNMGQAGSGQANTPPQNPRRRPLALPGLEHTSQSSSTASPQPKTPLSARSSPPQSPSLRLTSVRALMPDADTMPSFANRMPARVVASESQVDTTASSQGLAHADIHLQDPEQHADIHLQHSEQTAADLSSPEKEQVAEKEQVDEDTREPDAPAVVKHTPPHKSADHAALAVLKAIQERNEKRKKSKDEEKAVKKAEEDIVSILFGEHT